MTSSTYKAGDLIQIPADVYLYGSIDPDPKQPTLFSIPLKVTKKPVMGIFVKVVPNISKRGSGMAEVVLFDDVWRVPLNDVNWVKHVS